MPLVKTSIEPTNICRNDGTSRNYSELSGITNNALSNVIRQLADISRSAEQIFSDLTMESTKLMDTAMHLQDRIFGLHMKVNQLDSTVEEVSLQDINSRKPFSCNSNCDQQLMAPSSRPWPLSEQYQQCEPPPPLSLLTQYRDDGRDAMKFYTDPLYFFELWRKEMQIAAEQQKSKLHKRRRKKSKTPVEQPKVLREPATQRDKWELKKDGLELTQETAPLKRQQETDHRPSTSQMMTTPARPTHQRNGHAHAEIDGNHGYMISAPHTEQSDIFSELDALEQNLLNLQMHAASLPSAPVEYTQPPDTYYQQTNGVAYNTYGDLVYRSSLEPVSPPAVNTKPKFNSPYKASTELRSPAGLGATDTVFSSQYYGASRGTPLLQESANLPPPPPALMASPHSPTNLRMSSAAYSPSTPPLPPNSMLMRSSEALKLEDSRRSASPLTDVTRNKEAPMKASQADEENDEDPNDILTAIRRGIQLKKVEENKREVLADRRPSGITALDVQGIMDKAFEIRRKVLEHSDSESDHGWSSDEQ